MKESVSFSLFLPKTSPFCPLVAFFMKKTRDIFIRAEGVMPRRSAGNFVADASGFVDFFKTNFVF